MTRVRQQRGTAGDDYEEFSLVVDEHDRAEGEGMEPLAAADRVNSLPLDGPVVDAAHLQLIRAQLNLPPGLAEGLAAYDEKD